tara:strand:- start:174 stop:362 length:189 start_codon:yes stop_codon:yes gene_type:complete
MKYKMNKKIIKSFNALNDYQGLGKDVAEKLKAGESIEIKDPPEHLVKGGYLVKEETKKSGGK